MGNRMKIIQVLVTLAYGDGVGNDVLAIDRIIRECHYTTKIYAENIDPRIPSELVANINRLPDLKDEDIIIYHLSTGTDLNYRLRDLKGKKILVYHNVTPPGFFKEYSMSSYKLCVDGRKAMGLMKDVPDCCWADSGYNRQELMDAGYRCEIKTIPILIPFEDYGQPPDQTVINKYKDDHVNILFVGRIAPNKKQEDVIKTFYYYQKYINPRSRLFLAGSYNGMEKYYGKLTRYIDALQLENVYITGHVRFPEILSYYHVADVFLCMSEHEGFCIPLVEAMYFDIPIVAYGAAGVADTLGDAGLKMEVKDCREAAEMIDLLMQRDVLRDAILQGQQKRLREFSYESTRKKIIESIKEMTG